MAIRRVVRIVESQRSSIDRSFRTNCGDGISTLCNVYAPSIRTIPVKINGDWNRKFRSTAEVKTRRDRGEKQRFLIRRESLELTTLRKKYDLRSGLQWRAHIEQTRGKVRECWAKSIVNEFLFRSQRSSPTKCKCVSIGSKFPLRRRSRTSVGKKR